MFQWMDCTIKVYKMGGWRIDLLGVVSGKKRKNQISNRSLQVQFRSTLVKNDTCFLSFRFLLHEYEVSPTQRIRYLRIRYPSTRMLINYRKYLNE